MSEYPMFQSAINVPIVTDTQMLYQRPTPSPHSLYRSDLINADMEETSPTLFGCPERWRNMTSSALFTNAPTTPHDSPPIFSNLPPHSTAADIVMHHSPENGTRELSIKQCTAELDFNMAALDAAFAHLERIVQQNCQALAKTVEEQRKRRKGTTPMCPNRRYGSGAIRKRGQKQIPLSQKKSPGGSSNTNVVTFQFGRGRGSPPAKRNGAAGQSIIEMCDEALESFRFTDTHESYVSLLRDMSLFNEQLYMANPSDTSLFSERSFGIPSRRPAFGGPTSAPAGTLGETVMADMELWTGIEGLRLNTQERTPAAMEHQGRALCGAEELGVRRLSE